MGELCSTDPLSLRHEGMAAPLTLTSCVFSPWNSLSLDPPIPPAPHHTTTAGQQIPRVKYSDSEIATWGFVYNKLRRYTREYAVDSYNETLPQMEKVRK